LDEAIVELREAVWLKKDSPQARTVLGNALRVQGRLDEAMREYREAIRFKEDEALPHCNLGLALVQEGKFREGVEELRRGHALGSRQPGWPHPSAQWLRDAESMADLDARLPALLQGHEQLKDPRDRLAFAQFCQGPKQLFAAARWYREVFAREPTLADDLSAQHGYKAACSAALAGCGQGKDAARLDDQQQAGLRQQAMTWLRADLALRARQAAGSRPEDRPAAETALRHWLVDTDFAGVRGDGLAKLPESEQRAWRKLWADVADSLARDF